MHRWIRIVGLSTAATLAACGPNAIAPGRAAPPTVATQPDAPAQPTTLNRKGGGSSAGRGGNGGAGTTGTSGGAASTESSGGGSSTGAPATGSSTGSTPAPGGDGCAFCLTTQQCSGATDDCVYDPTVSSSFQAEADALDGYCAPDCANAAKTGPDQSRCAEGTECLEAVNYAFLGTGDAEFGTIDWACFPESGTCVDNPENGASLTQQTGGLPAGTCSACNPPDGDLSDVQSCNGPLESCVFDPSGTGLTTCAIPCADANGNPAPDRCFGGTSCVSASVASYLEAIPTWVCLPPAGTCATNPGLPGQTCQSCDGCGFDPDNRCVNDPASNAAGPYCAGDCADAAGTGPDPSLCFAGTTSCTEVDAALGSAGDDGQGHDWVCYPKSGSCAGQ
ncbi:MAG TPA: hypothetical protein VMB50_03460 [Myxococcales bacterium]|nr:hypothetical protein [Myxococcales bacterium]